MSDSRRFARRDVNDADHAVLKKKIESISEDVSYIRGKIDGMDKQKSSDYTVFGTIVAILMGVWNMIR